jgi:hypothetical protein
MPEKACIELEPEKIGASKAPNQHDALAPLPAQRAKSKPDLPNSSINMREAFDAGRCVSCEPNNERAISACSSGLGDSHGERAAPSDDPNPLGLLRASNTRSVLTLPGGEGHHTESA